MRVLHIIPAAFNYFDDIRFQAFKVVDGLSLFGIEAEAFTLQYGNTSMAEGSESPAQHRAARGNASQFMGMSTLADALATFAAFDILHVHAPLPAAAGKVIAWKKAHPHFPLVVSYYRPVKVVDFYSVGLLAYNALYMPALAAAADCLAVPSSPTANAVAKNRIGRRAPPVVVVDDSTMLLGQDLTAIEGSVQLEGSEMLAYKYALLYTDLLALQK